MAEAQAALVVNSVDAVVEVGATASLIILGEDHAVTAKLNQIQDYLAPVTAVTGVLTLDFSKITSLANITKGQSGEQLLGAVDYIGNSLVDLIWNDKFMGVDFSKSEGTAGPTTDMTLSAVDISDASLANDPAAIGAKVNEELGGLGLPALPESALPGAAQAAEKPALDRAKETAPKAPPKSVDDYINELLDWLVDVGILTAEEADKYRLDGGKVDIAGTYSGTYSYTLSGSEGSNTFTGSVRVDVTLAEEISNTYAVMFWMSAPGSGLKEETYNINGVAVFDESAGLVSLSGPVNEVLGFDASFDRGSVAGTIKGGNEFATVDISFTATRQ